MRALKWGLLTVALCYLGSFGWIHAKAVLAQYLIDDAWQQTQQSGNPVRPWPWADSWPIARLTLIHQRHPLGSWSLLSNSSGHALAFGPGWLPGSARPGEHGTTLIAAHRDTQFAALQQLQPGDEIVIETQKGEKIIYQISGHRIVDSRSEPLLTVDDNSRRLTLITCYPFDAIQAGGPMRYLVDAQAQPSPQLTAELLRTDNSGIRF